MQTQNIFSDIHEDAREELTRLIGGNRQVRIERIISTGQITPEGSWYDQSEDEFVLLIKGEAKIQLLDPDVAITLLPGDFLTIPAHRKHRVDYTSLQEPTIWLTVFYS